MQTIQRKYGNKSGRSREPVDLLDRPGVEAGCQVFFNWFSPIGNSRQKFSYSVCDPQWIDLDCVISTVTLEVNPLQPKVFKLHPEDTALDNFVKSKIN